MRVYVKQGRVPKKGSRNSISRVRQGKCLAPRVRLRLKPGRQRSLLICTQAEAFVFSACYLLQFPVSPVLCSSSFTVPCIHNYAPEHAIVSCSVISQDATKNALMI